MNDESVAIIFDDFNHLTFTISAIIILIRTTNIFFVQ